MSPDPLGPANPCFSEVSRFNIGQSLTGVTQVTTMVTNLLVSARILTVGVNPNLRPRRYRPSGMERDRATSGEEAPVATADEGGFGVVVELCVPGAVERS